MYEDAEDESGLSAEEADEVAVTKRGRHVKMPAKYKAEVASLLAELTSPAGIYAGLHVWLINVQMNTPIVMSLALPLRRYCPIRCIAQHLLGRNTLVIECVSTSLWCTQFLHAHVY